MAASFFWDRVAQHHSYATGGHGLAEYFGPPDQLSARVDGRACESCNVYNMLKLTRRLFSLRPDAFYADFHERALFNHVLASIDPEDGATSYMVPVGRGVQQEYQDMLQSFTCCVGTGMESHALHGVRHLLRVGRHALGESLRAVDGAVHDGRREAHDGNGLPRRRRREDRRSRCRRRRSSRSPCGARCGPATDSRSR